MTLGQRVAVMRAGRVVQVDAPQRLYEEPRDLFVAAFIGSPAMNLVDAAIAEGEAAFGQFRIPLDTDRRPPASARRVVLGIRPEAFEDAMLAPPGMPTIEIQVEVLEELGSDAYVFFGVDAPRITAEAVEASAEDASLLAEERALFTARVDPRSAARVGSRLRLAVDPARFHFFDPETGASLVAQQADLREPVLAT
jgi:multiple sugar transport system ATP-binding protein